MRWCVYAPQWGMWFLGTLYQGLLSVVKVHEGSRWGSLGFAALGIGSTAGGVGGRWRGGAITLDLVPKWLCHYTNMCPERPQHLGAGINLWVRLSLIPWGGDSPHLPGPTLPRMQTGKRQLHHKGQIFCFSPENTNAFCFIPLLDYLPVQAWRINEVISTKHGTQTVSGSQEALNKC